MSWVCSDPIRIESAMSCLFALPLYIKTIRLPVDHVVVTTQLPVDHVIRWWGAAYHISGHQLVLSFARNLFSPAMCSLHSFFSRENIWGQIQRKNCCMGPYAGADYNLSLCPLQSRLLHIYHGQTYARVDFFSLSGTLDFASGSKYTWRMKNHLVCFHSAGIKGLKSHE
jgi:hypothetical protein